jgi:hypothetical protein
MQISFKCDNKEFTIKSNVWGKEIISLNGKVVSEKRNLTNLNSVHRFNCEDQSYELRLKWDIVQQLGHVILTCQSQILYDQDVNLKGKPFDTQRITFPKWSYIFIILCGIIPLVTRGGAVPVVIGVLGIGGCTKVSRKSTLSNIVRIIICLVITVMCWLSLAILAFFIVALNEK